MDRRAFLKTAATAGALANGGLFASPAISQRVAARALRLVPLADLAIFDPIWSFAYPPRNAGVLVWDTLYGMDSTLQIQRQMVEAEEVSPDELTWTFRLRPGLKFHDGEPVLAKDVLASIKRWSARDPMGQMIKAIENELVAVDDRTFHWTLKRPYRKLRLALGKIGTPCCFIMPARIARPTRSSRSANTSAAGRCGSSGTNGCRVHGQCLRDSTRTCRARSRHRGMLAANGWPRTA
jgi:peptide/nickel transport system substrate-binding protein